MARSLIKKTPGMRTSPPALSGGAVNPKLPKARKLLAKAPRKKRK